MSTSSTLVTAEHFRYIAERTAQEDDFLRDLKRDAAAARQGQGCRRDRHARRLFGDQHGPRIAD
jgi:hypothetical protein